MAVRRSRKEEAMADRLSDMPESLQLRVLSCLEARHAVQTLVLSKSWVSSWTCIPVLSFSSDGFKNFNAFDKFVVDALSRRQPVKLDKLSFKYARTCSPELLEKVLGYGFSHGVQELEAYIVDTVNQMHEDWPIYTSSDSLTSLKLKSKFSLGCLFLEPRSVSFKNLTNLHLHRVLIKHLDPFSGFPVLDKLTLVCCTVETIGRVLNVHAPQLSEFSFFYYLQYISRCEFMTPKLRYFEWAGNGFPRLKCAFPALDTVVINYNGHCIQNEKISFDDLLMFFDTLYSARSLTVSAAVVHLLALFPDDRGTTPFRDLKCLKLDFSLDHVYVKIKSVLFLSQALKLVPGVKAYLLRKSHNAKCTIINHPNAETHASRKLLTSDGQAAKEASQHVTPLPLAQSRPKRMVKKPARFLDCYV